jgi:hypothetical protein
MEGVKSTAELTGGRLYTGIENLFPDTTYASIPAEIMLRSS